MTSVVYGASHGIPLGTLDGAGFLSPASRTSREGRVAGCICNRDTLSVVHAYLKRHFSERPVRNLHAPTSTNLMRAGVLGDSGDYHVVSIAADPPSHAVLLKDFLEQPLAEVEECLRHWDLARALHVHRIVIVGSTHVSAL